MLFESRAVMHVVGEAPDERLSSAVTLAGRNACWFRPRSLF